jgi:hypothetical protein
MQKQFIAIMVVIGTWSSGLDAQVFQQRQFSPTPQPINAAQQINAAQRYLLKTGNLESIATFDGSRLVINSGGTSHMYSRMQTLDSRDGAYLGFYNRPLDKTIRFPIAGNGRIQVAGAYGNWKWSQMQVTRLAQANVSPHQRIYEQIDNLAVQVQRQAQQIGSEAAIHYQHTPQYRHLVSDTSELVKQSAHLHEVAHNHGTVDHMAADMAKLDASFHHLETTFEGIHNRAAIGIGHVDGHIAHVKALLGSMETNLHQLQRDIASLQPHVVLRPTTFGRFANIDGLAHRLETQSNQLLLDLHYNYSHNTGFKQAYKEAYQVLTVAKDVHAADPFHQAAIQQKLRGMDQLVHHLQDDFRPWTRHAHQQVGQLGLNQKLQGLASTVNELMNDAGVAPTPQAPTPIRAPQPLTTAPPPIN